jgi:death-on-curing protein
MVEAFHTDQLQQHQGRAGIRDENLLESALHRPVNKWHYGETDFATLAAAYGFGIASNHPFVDGNKRVAFVSMVVFLRLNGLRFSASQADVVEALRAVADRRLTEEQLADWVRSRMGSG